MSSQRSSRSSSISYDHSSQDFNHDHSSNNHNNNHNSNNNNIKLSRSSSLPIQFPSFTFSSPPVSPTESFNKMNRHHFRRHSVAIKFTPPEDCNYCSSSQSSPSSNKSNNTKNNQSQHHSISSLPSPPSPTSPVVTHLRRASVDEPWTIASDH